jgi:hypothetical protein
MYAAIGSRKYVRLGDKNDPKTKLALFISMANIIIMGHFSPWSQLMQQIKEKYFKSIMKG